MHGPHQSIWTATGNVNEERGKESIYSQAPSHHWSFLFRGVDLSCTPQLCVQGTRWVSTSRVCQRQRNLLGQDVRVSEARLSLGHTWPWQMLSVGSICINNLI